MTQLAFASTSGCKEATLIIHIVVRLQYRRFSGSFILDITYGLNVASKEDIYITQAEKGMTGMTAAGTTSSYLVDFIPRLQYLPSWLPGMRFKRNASELRVHALAIPREPLNFVEAALVSSIRPHRQPRVN